jgi:hypothetical protein
MATKGRGGDSLLVHMTPEEVQSLQAMALKGGGTLTINPDTGLPEANFLKKMLPMIAGFALGPAGFGLMSAGMAGAAVGGITALSTGSLSRGLMAGLGAYGGAGLGAGLAGAGAGAAQEAAMAGVGEGASQAALNEAAAKATTDFMGKGMVDRLTEGATAAFNNPSSFVQGMGGMGKTAAMGLAAISPMMADQGVQTTTKRPDTGTIRNYTFDPYGQTYTSAGNYPASEYKGMAQGGIVALAAGGTSYLDLTKDSTPAQVAAAYKQFTAGAGGDTQANRDAAIAYLGNLGIASPTIGQAYEQFQAAPTYTDYTQQNVTDYLRANPNIDIAAETARLNADPVLVNQVISQLGAGFLDPTQAAPTYTDYTQQNVTDYLRDNKNIDIAAETARLNADPVLVNQAISQLGAGFLDPTQAAPTYTDYTQQNVTDYLRANPNIDIAAETARLNADPVLVNQAISQLGAGFLDPTETKGGSGSMQYFDTFSEYGIDANELSAANMALNPNYSADEKAKYAEGIARAFETAKDFKGFDPQGETQLLKDIEWVKQMDATGSNTFDIARLTGLSIGEVTAREAAARAAMAPKPTPAPTPAPTAAPGIAGIPTPEGTTLPGGVSGGGNTVVNPDGTITTAPNIPGRPPGGFTGTGQVRDVYTQGGGSLGYTNTAPKTMEEFNERFNRQTGDSLNAYNYLMGKGANNNAYPYKSGVEQIMRPYNEVTRGIPAAEGRPTQKYIYQDGRYVENPNYRPLSYDSKGNRNVGMSSGEVLKGFQALPDKTDDAAIFDWVDENKITIAQLAAAMGISVGEAQRRMAAIGKTKGATINSAGYISDGGDGAASTAGFSTMGTNNAPVSAMGGDIGFGDDGVGPAGGGGDTGNAPGSDGTPGSGAARGGLLPRRMALGGLGSLAKGGVAELPDGAFVVPARITSELGNGSTNAGAQKLFAMEQRLLGKNAQPVNLGRYSGGGNLVRGKGDGVSDSVPATIGGRQPARIADGESVVSRKAVEKLGDGSIEAGARKLYAMMDRVQKARGKTTGKNRVAANTRADKYLPA